MTLPSARSPLHSLSAAASSMKSSAARVLTSKTKSGPAMEGHKPPTDICQFVSFPPFRPKGVGVLAVEALETVHVVRGPADALSPADQDRGLAIRAAATGNDGGFGGNPHVEVNGRV